MRNSNNRWNCGAIAPCSVRAWLVALLACVAVAVLTGNSQADTHTWVGNTGTLWSTADWNPPGAPVNGDLLIFDAAGSAGTSLTQDIATLTSFGGITFNSTAAAYTITGTTAETLAGNITVNSANTQTLVMPIAISGARNVTVASGGKLVFGSTGTANAYSVNTGTTTFSGAGEISVLSNSTGSFKVSGASPLDMSTLGRFTADVGVYSVVGTTTGTCTQGRRTKILT